MTKETLACPVNDAVEWQYKSDFNVSRLTIPDAIVNLAYDNDSLLTGAGALTLTRDSQNGFLTGTALGNITDTYTYSTFGETPYSYDVFGYLF